MVINYNNNNKSFLGNVYVEKMKFINMIFQKERNINIAKNSNHK